MNSCTFVDFMETLKPWLNSDYIKIAHVDDTGQFTLIFVDGGQKSFYIDDCTSAQLKDIAVYLKDHGVQIVKSMEKKHP